MWMIFSLLVAIHHMSIISFLSLAPILLFKTLGILATSLALKSPGFLMFFISINNATYISYLSVLIFLGPNMLAHLVLWENCYQQQMENLYLFLMLLTIAVLWVLFSTSLSQDQKSHLQAAKRILRYLKGTATHGLSIHASPSWSLQGYTDAD